MAETDRDILFANEAFLIGVLQAVSGGAIVAALAQSDTLIKFAGRVPFLVFVTAMGLGLLAAVVSAYSKHQYKMWDVKAHAARSDAAEGASRSASAKLHLSVMRKSMFFALVCIIVALLELLAAMWVHAACSAFVAYI